MKKKPAIIIDLDGTLSNADQRLYLLDYKPKKWDEFFAEAKNDRANQWCKDIINNFQWSHVILLVTGRGEEERANTTAWLKKNKIKYDALIMRPAKDKRPDTIVKSEIYRTQIRPNYRVVFAVDDRASVIKMWRGHGVTALQCSDWEDSNKNNVHKEIAKYYQTKDNR